MELVDIADLMKNVEFKVFNGPANDPKGRIVVLRVPNGGEKMTRKQIDEYGNFVGNYGAKGLAWVKVNDLAAGLEGLQSPILKFMPEAVIKAVLERAGDLAVATAGLVNMNNRWVGVNWLTMESSAVPGVHVLGDSTFSAPAMPKSGHMANQHAKVAAAAIIQLLKGEPVSPTPVVMNTCYSFVTRTDVVHVASVHQYDAADKTFKTVPGSGGVSAAANQIEGRYALSWADNIWADMLNV
jgi:hypothetical protein